MRMEMEHRNSVLIVEDDVNINGLLKEALEKEGYICTQAFSGTEARMILQGERYSVILLDLMLPGIPGEEVLRDIRKKGNTPVIILTAKDTIDDKVEFLRGGADDYVTKPFQTGELAARVKSQLRRYQKFGVQDPAECTDEIRLENLHIDKSLHAVEAFGKQVHLTHLEFEILYLLASHPGQIFSTDEIFEKVWKEKSYDMSNTVMVHIRRLREKLEGRQRKAQIIKTVWGVGYKIEA